MRKLIAVSLGLVAWMAAGVNPAAGATLYGATAGNTNTGDLYTINTTTGNASLIGSIGFAVTGLAFDPLTGILFGSTSRNSISPGSLITINPATGAGTLVGAYGLSGDT